MQQASETQGTGAAYRVRMNGRLPLTDCRAACVVVAIVWPYRLCMLYSNSPFACFAVTGSVCARRQPLSQHTRYQQSLITPYLQTILHDSLCQQVTLVPSGRFEAPLPMV